MFESSGRRELQQRMPRITLPVWTYADEESPSSPPFPHQARQCLVSGRRQGGSNHKSENVAWIDSSGVALLEVPDRDEIVLIRGMANGILGRVVPHPRDFCRIIRFLPVVLMRRNCYDTL